jgi:hypothetical protein
MHFRWMGFAVVVGMWLTVRPTAVLAQEPGTLGFSVVELYNRDTLRK